MSYQIPLEKLEKLQEQIRLAKTLVTINEAYKETIDEKIAQLRRKLELNQSQQADLIQEISTNNVEKNVAKEKMMKHNSYASRSEHSQVSCIRANEIMLNKIRSNYFKDHFNSEPASNMDTLRKSKLDFYDYIPQLKPEWSVKYRNKLKVAVFKDATRLLQRHLKQRISFLEEKLHKLNISMEGTKKTLRQIQVQLKDTKIKCREIEHYTELEILRRVDYDQIDWMKIAKIDLDSQWSSSECRLVWENVCSIEINQAKWTHVELKRLVELARKYNEKDWAKICAELDNGRSAYLCMKRYHEKTVDKYCKRDWSDEETLELCTIADKLKIGQYIPYNYLCYLNGSRDRNSIYNWHIKIDPNLNHGKWAPGEEQAFDEALMFYNTVYNWQEISEHVVTRTAHQCKDRYELKYHNPDKYINWTIQDDTKLLESYKHYEGQWYKIAAFEFPNRNDNACLFRFTRLMAWHKQNVWFDSQTSEIQEFILFICKQRLKTHDRTPVFTEDGQLVPKKPVFNQNLANLADQIAEKKELITEFIQQKRKSQLNLQLISQIGIYTPALNATLLKLEKNGNEKKDLQAVKLEQNELKCQRQKALKLERQLTNPKKLMPKLPLNERSKGCRPPVKKSKYIRDVIPGGYVAPKKGDKLGSFNQLINQKRQRAAKKASEIGKMKSLDKGYRDPSQGMIKNYFQSANYDLKLGEEEGQGATAADAATNSDNLHLSGNNQPTQATRDDTTTNPPFPTTIHQPLTSTTTKKSKQKPTICHPVYIRHLINTSPTTTPKPKQPVQKRPIKSPKFDLNVNSGAKKPKKTHDTLRSVSFLNVSQNLLETSQMKSLKLSKFEKSLDPVELSPLVVKFEDVPDEEKITCISEQNSLFKFMYLVKKTPTNLKYFYKYTVIRCGGRFVAVKPFNTGNVTGEYLNEARLAAINEILDQINKR